jgi:hypothetical protein
MKEKLKKNIKSKRETMQPLRCERENRTSEGISLNALSICVTDFAGKRIIRSS